MISKYRSLLAFLLLFATPSAWPASIDAALSMPGRLPADLERDKRSRPEVIVPLLNLSSGDRVVDLFGSGGYYSDIIASVVGEQG